MKLFLVRHGETDWNRKGRFQGQIDIPLNERGLSQANMTAERFRGVKLDVVCASPLSRARITGEAIARAAGCELITDPAFLEICHGDWQGHTADEVMSLFGDQLHQWQTCPDQITMPGQGGESLEDVRRRAVDGVERLIAGRSNDVLLATHDAVIKALICHYIHLSFAYYWRVKVPNCSVSYIEFTPSGPQLGLMGDISHLHSGFDSFVSKSL